MSRAGLERFRKDPLLTLANTPYALLFTVIGSWLFFGIAFALIEGTSISDGLYWSVVTLSTTGYGDISPATGLGKVLAGSYMVWSLFYLLPCAIFHVADKLIIVPDEFNDDDKLELQAQLNRIEAAIAAKEIV